MKNYTKPTNPTQRAPMPDPARIGDAPSEKQIRVDGYEQVIAMLKIADPEFRESLLRRLTLRDRDLAKSLIAELRAAGVM